MDLATAVQQVLDSHWYVLGQQVQGFESEFARYIGTEHCVSVANGTDALELALRAVGVVPGDKVVTVANAGFYGSTAIRAIGAVPLYADVDETTLTLSPMALEQALASQPAAVIVTHLYGQMADMPALSALCERAGVPLIEDCAQGHGASLAGRKAGSWGQLGCFSFYPTKNLGALGDGGAITTGDAALAAGLRTLRQYGWSHKYTVAVPGGRNSRLDEIQAAILRVKLPLLDSQNAQRRQIAAHYNRALAALPLQCPPSVNCDNAAHLYVLRSPVRDALRAFLQAHGIATDVHYPVADHLQPAYSHAHLVGALEVTQAACAEVVSLPCYPGMSQADVDRVIGVVQAFFMQDKGPAC
ncbi:MULTISPECIES: DegT/DnrJ/EryC1/StrS aminotransferase family protein [unclassified Acidovorax]|uniref:DegT/DnrJ/EryC1/StrS family aminotransferase n=1 Tax=unclassified Acidovorax TaxID=2684926 RepID=UPI000AF30467|nr:MULTISPECIES: DegT/DnrJ/EryC1/StrS family aminotransferase [unclassified Acidovorax]